MRVSKRAIRQRDAAPPSDASGRLGGACRAVHLSTHVARGSPA